MSKLHNKKIAKGYYERLRSIISQIPLKSDNYSYVEDSIVQRYHEIINEASRALGKNYDDFKVSELERQDFAWSEYNERHDYRWKLIPVRTKMYELVVTLKTEYQLEKESIWEVLRNCIIEGIKNISNKILVGVIVGTIVAILVAYLLIRLGLQK